MSDPAWQKGLKFLVSTQARDGTWRVRTRMISPAEVSPEYFTTGFPYGKDEFLSYAGSCWAVMALMSALPESGRSITEPQAASSTEVPWAQSGAVRNGERSQDTSRCRTRSKQQDRERDDAADDGGARRGEGSPARCARCRREESGAAGTDALTIAAAHYGTSTSLRALLDAGAEAQPSERRRHSADAVRGDERRHRERQVAARSWCRGISQKRSLNR